MTADLSQNPANGPTEADKSDVAAVERLGNAFGVLRKELAKVIVGQDAVLEQLMIALLSGGHCLLVGVPGLAKTLVVRTLSRAIDLNFNRVQFTPDLMPADITGTELIQEDRLTGERSMRFMDGPVFTNVLLADEINRTPPKTQAALLEAMQELQVTVGGQRHAIEAPFFVLATQNPIEQEGTYPLPEAQLDRFMMQVHVDYPSEDEEFEIVRRTTRPLDDEVKCVLDRTEIESLRQVVRRVPIADHLIHYALQFVRLTRCRDSAAPAFVQRYVSWGAGPRASQDLVLAAQARAMLRGRCLVTVEDIHAVAVPVLRHRIILNFHAEADRISTDDIVNQLQDTISKSFAENTARGRVSGVFRPSGSE